MRRTVPAIDGARIDVDTPAAADGLPLTADGWGDGELVWYASCETLMIPERERELEDWEEMLTDTDCDDRETLTDWEMNCEAMID